MPRTTRILDTNPVTHDVREFIVEKPTGYTFTPGQATDVAINRPGLEDDKHPFTFTSLSDDEQLEFTIKIYDDHDGMTHRLGKLKPGDELILEDPWGAIQYDGPGVFLAGGAGVTPFIAILRQLEREGGLEGNTLIFANKTEADIILHQQFNRMLGGRAIYALSQESKPGYESGRITQPLLEKHIHDFSQRFYLCGPPSMVKDLTRILADLGADTDSALVVEE